MDGASVSNDVAYGLCGAVRTWGGEAKWEFGELEGFHANCAWSGYVSNQEVSVFGDYNGNVWEMEVGPSFDGAAISAIYKTPYLDFGDTTIRKNIHRVDLFARIEGPFATTVNLTYDWDRTEVQNPSGYALTAGEDLAVYDDGSLYDDGSVFGGSAQPVFFLNTQGSGYSVQVTISQTGVIVAPYTIQGMVFSFTPLGRN
jgi:hypothetical protein